MNPEAVKEKQSEATIALDEVALKQFTFKPSTMRDVMVTIVVSMLDDRIQWSDEVDLGFVAAPDRNCIGNAWRTLAHAGVIKPMGQFRKSVLKSRKSAKAFKYRLASQKLAETFLARNGRTPARRGQPELFNINT